MILKKKNPISFAKSRINVFPKQGRSNNNYIKFIHVQDIEDYYDEFQREKFQKLIGEIEEAKKKCNIPEYELGYTNYSFDLWMVIHKYDLKISVSNRHDYYKYINRGYNKKYTGMDDYKSEKEFSDILKQISLCDVINAVNRGHQIRRTHEENGDHFEMYKKFKYYRDNPDMTIQNVTKSILKDCKIINKPKKS